MEEGCFTFIVIVLVLGFIVWGIQSCIDERTKRAVAIEEIRAQERREEREREERTIREKEEAERQARLAKEEAKRRAEEQKRATLILDVVQEWHNSILRGNKSKMEELSTVLGRTCSNMLLTYCSDLQGSFRRKIESGTYKIQEVSETAAQVVSDSIVISLVNVENQWKINEVSLLE